MSIDELDGMTRGEIKQMLLAERNKPANKGLKRADLARKLRDQHATVLAQRGYTEREIAALATDIDSYFPEEFTKAGREV